MHCWAGDRCFLEEGFWRALGFHRFRCFVDIGRSLLLFLPFAGSGGFLLRAVSGDRLRLKEFDIAEVLCLCFGVIVQNRPLRARLCEPQAHTGDRMPARRVPEKLPAAFRFLYCRKRFLPGTRIPSAFRTTRHLQYARMGSQFIQFTVLRFTCSPLGFTFFRGLGRSADHRPREIHNLAPLYRARVPAHQGPRVSNKYTHLCSSRACFFCTSKCSAGPQQLGGCGDLPFGREGPLQNP